MIRLGKGTNLRVLVFGGPSFHAIFSSSARVCMCGNVKGPPSLIPLRPPPAGPPKLPNSSPINYFYDAWLRREEEGRSGEVGMKEGGALWKGEGPSSPPQATTGAKAVLVAVVGGRDSKEEDDDEEVVF